MRTLFVAAATAVLTVGLAPTAQAHPTYHYHGGCEVHHVRTAGGFTVTEFTAAVVATAAGNDLPARVFISVDCELYSGGSYSGTPVSASGFAAAADSSLLSWTGLNYVDQLCERVEVAWETHFACQPL